MFMRKSRKQYGKDILTVIIEGKNMYMIKEEKDVKIRSCERVAKCTEYGRYINSNNETKERK